MLVKWLGLFPALLAVSYAFEWAPIDPPLWAKLLMETAVLVPFLNYIVTPAMDSLFSDWLYAGVEDASQGSGGGS